MTQQRSSHEQKTDDDRRRYIETTVKRVESPTVDATKLAIDSTETIRSEDSEPAEDFRSTYRRESKLGQLLRDKWPELLFAALLTWMGTQLYSLNREVGELRQQLEYRRTAQEKIASDLEKAEERLRHELEKLDTKIETKRNEPPAGSPTTGKK